jgi:hypothetical protein
LIKEGANLKENNEIEEDLLGDAFQKEVATEKISHHIGQ